MLKKKTYWSIFTMNIQHKMGKAERTKQFIIEKASSIFNVKGIAGTSIEEVLNASKIARGCLYGHFETKDQLALACTDYMLETSLVQRNELMNKQSTARGKIFAFIDMNKNPMQSFIDGGCPMTNLSTEADDTNPLIKKKLRNDIDAYLKLFNDLLEEGIRNGEFSEELIPEEYAIKMYTSIKGANVICRIKNSAKPMQLVIKSLKSELNSYCPDSLIK